MTGKYRTPKRAKRVTLSEDRYLRCISGRWWLYKRVKIANSTEGETAWLKSPLSPQVARRLMLTAGIEGDEEGRP